VHQLLRPLELIILTGFQPRGFSFQQAGLPIILFQKAASGGLLPAAYYSNN
jgi:hypothetical protein